MESLLHLILIYIRISAAFEAVLRLPLLQKVLFFTAFNVSEVIHCKRC